jgi:hypothetical protein
MNKFFCLSALLCVGLALWFGQTTIAVLAIFAHLLGWQNHVIEIKLNKFLDDRGIFVSHRELSE